MTPNERDEKLETVIWLLNVAPSLFNSKDNLILKEPFYQSQEQRWILMRNDAVEFLKNYRASIEAPLKAEIERLREALAFYAYSVWNDDYLGGITFRDKKTGNRYLDTGDRARAALAASPVEPEQPEATQ